MDKSPQTPERLDDHELIHLVVSSTMLISH